MRIAERITTNAVSRGSMLLCLSAMLMSRGVSQALNIRVAFVRGGEVGIADADGTNLQILTHGAFASQGVHWSPGRHENPVYLTI